MTNPTFHTDYEKAVSQIPAYLKNSLTADDSAWMKGFLGQLQNSDPAKAAAFAQEMQWVEKTQKQMSQALPHMDINAGWEQLSGQLTDKASPEAPAAPLAEVDPLSIMGKAVRWASERIRKLMNGLLDLWRKPAVVVLGSAMIVSQMGLLAAVVKKMYTTETTGMAIPASGSKSAASDQVVMIQVVFKDQTSVADIRKLLETSGAQIVGGPSAIGVWEVQIEKLKQTATIDQISTSKHVESISLP